MKYHIALYRNPKKSTSQPKSLILNPDNLQNLAFQTISSKDQNQLDTFNRLLNEDCKNGFIKKIFRGDKVDRLFERMNIHYDRSNPNWRPVLERLFIIGEKSQHFFSEGSAASSKKTFRLEDVDEGVFSSLFNHLNTATRNKRPSETAFFKRNSTFRDYFKDKTNLPDFLHLIRGRTEKEKLGIKQYYMTLVHQLGVVNYNSQSTLISTSTSKLQALQFASYKRKKNPWYVIHAWTPSTTSITKFLDKINYPKYEGSPFKKQEEASLLAGILPHYLIGIQIMGEKLMFYNPAIFSETLTQITTFTGLNINQDQFDEIANETLLKGKFITDGENMIQDFIAKAK